MHLKFNRSNIDKPDVIRREDIKLKSIKDQNQDDRIKKQNVSLNLISKLDGLPKTLIKFNISSNRISFIHGMDHLSQLTSQNLSYNQISIMEKLNLPNQTKLNLSYNQIKVFCGLEKCKKIRQIKAQHNQIESIYAPPVGNQIEEIDISWNNLSRISDYEVNTLQELSSLNVSHNRLEELTFLTTLKMLSEIDASYNKISKLSTKLKKYDYDNVTSVKSSSNNSTQSTIKENQPMSNITGITLLKKKNANSNISIDTVKQKNQTCPILYKQKLDHNFQQVFDGIEDWCPQVCVLDIRNNMVAGESALYFIFHQDSQSEIFFEGNDFYYKGIEERYSLQVPFLEVICGKKFAKLGERERVQKEELNQYMLDTGLAKQDEIDRIYKDYQDSVKHIELDSNILAKIYDNDENGEQDDEMIQSARQDFKEDILKKKILKAEHMAQIKNIEAQNQKIVDDKGKMKFGDNRLEDKLYDDDDLADSKFLEESIETTNQFSKFKDNYEKDFVDLSNEIEASLKKMNSYFNEQVEEDFPTIKTIHLDVASFKEHRDTRDSELSEISKNRLDNWPERVLKGGNNDPILKPLKTSSTKSSQIHSIHNKSVTGDDANSNYINLKITEKMDKDELFLKKGHKFGKKKSEALISSMYNDDPYRPNSSKTSNSFRLRGNASGISSKSFSTNGMLNDELTIPSNKTNFANQAVVAGNKVSTMCDPSNRALALQKQNDHQKKMIGEDKLNMQNSMNTTTNIHLNPIKNPPPKVKLKPQKDKDI